MYDMSGKKNGGKGIIKWRLKVENAFQKKGRKIN
jgi:hypothetical protein